MLDLEHYLKHYKYKVTGWDWEKDDLDICKDMTEDEKEIFNQIEPKLKQLITLRDEITSLSKKLYKEKSTSNNNFHIHLSMNEPAATGHTDEPNCYPPTKKDYADRNLDCPDWRK